MTGSRLKQDAQRLFECFCEVVAPKGAEPAWIIQKFPESYKDESVLKSIPSFTFPCAINRTVSQVFTFILTNLEAKWMFGYCRLDAKSDTAIVVLSYLPWHEQFSEFLSYISDIMHGAHSNLLWKFLSSIHATNVSSPGYNVAVSIPPLKLYEIEAPSPFKLPSIPGNKNLTEYYNAVDGANMVSIFASMLAERRIIFTSKKLCRLSACVQSANDLLYPMSWQHIFIPVLPKSMIDVLLAPMPYLIGLHESLLQYVPFKDLGEVVILDADSNHVKTPFQDAEKLPHEVTHGVQKHLRNPALLLGDGVSRAFLRALVQLIGGYRDALKISQGKKITFDKEAFIESRPESMRSFLEGMTHLQIFQEFIEDRLNLLNAGLGFSDEFELEVCNYSSDKSASKMQQYREWVHNMKKGGSAFFRNIKIRANPAVKSAVKSVKDRGKNVTSVYKGIRSKFPSKDKREGKAKSAPSSPINSRSRFADLDPRNNAAPTDLNDGADSCQFRKLRNSPSMEDLPKVDMEMMEDLQDAIFHNWSIVSKTGEESHAASTSWNGNTNSPSSSKAAGNGSAANQAPDLIRLDSCSSSIADFDPLSEFGAFGKEGEGEKEDGENRETILSPSGLINPLYLFDPKGKELSNSEEMLREYGLNFSAFLPSCKSGFGNGSGSGGDAINNDKMDDERFQRGSNGFAQVSKGFEANASPTRVVAKSKPEWTTFE